MWKELIDARDKLMKPRIVLSEETKISSQTLNAWENEMPEAFVRLIKLAVALKVSPNELLGWSVYTPPAKKTNLNAHELAVIQDALIQQEKRIKAELIKQDSVINVDDVQQYNDTFTVRQYIEVLMEESE